MTEMARMTNEASYFERAQDFSAIIKALRIKYLGLKPMMKKTKDGDVYYVYIRDTSKTLGLNKEGVEANVRFLELRMGKHVALTSWDEERMFVVMKDDMLTWRDMMLLNYERYEMSPALLLELRTTINDMLEVVYRRGIGDAERDKMRPIGKEIKRLFGFDRDEKEQGNTGREWNQQQQNNNQERRDY